MNPPEFFSGSGGGSRPSPRRELQGPRPAALKVNKDSYKIRKPPIAPPPQPHPPPLTAAEDRQPVIIYAVSPKVIHTTVSDFMSLVQRLTGNNGAEGSAGAGSLSPAARLASIERTGPSNEREIDAGIAGESSRGDFLGDLLPDSAVELACFPGILSPAPASLPPISAGLFSPAAVDPFMSGYNMFIPSPSTLFSTPMASPSSSLFDPFNPFFDF